MIKRFFLMSILAAVSTTTHLAQAQEAYPSRPIRLVVPYPAGGGADGLGRLIGQRLSESFKQTVIIDNKPGANTIIGSSEVARAPADGYTLLLNTTSFTTNPALYKVPYDSIKAFTPVAIIAKIPLIIVRSERAPYHSLAALIAAAKANPGAINYATYGAGSPAHLSAELLELMADIKMTHIPYKGSAAAMSDLMADQIQLSFASIEPAIPLIAGKKIFPIAVMSKTRLPSLPDVPTVAETFPGFDTDGWNGIVAPAGTPAAIVSALNRAVNEAVTSPEVQAKFAKQGIRAEPMSPGEFAALIRTEVIKWGDVIKKADVKVE